MRGPSSLRALMTSAAALMMASMVASGIGMIFWTAAARLFPAETVGKAAAAVSAAVLLGTLAQLNISALFVRFLAVSGRRAVRFVATGYAVTGSLAFVVGLGFAFSGIGNSYLGRSASTRLTFAALVVVSMLVIVEDAVLTSLRKAPTVLASNVAIAVSKLTMVLSFGLFAVRADLILVWLAPMALVLAVISTRIFRVWLPQLMAEHPDDDHFPGPRQLLSFLGAEYLTRLLSIVPPTLVPLVIVEVLGPGENAYFTVPWTINEAIGAAIWSTGGAFVAEGVAARGLSYDSIKAMLRINAAIVIGGAIGELIAADLLLGLLGHEYAVHGGVLLRWLALGVPFQGVTLILISFVWIEGRVWFLVGLQIVDNILFMSLGFGLLRSHGIAAIGVAFVLAQALLAVGSFYPVLRRVREARRTGFLSVDALSSTARAARTRSGTAAAEPDPAGDVTLVATVDGAGTRGGGDDRGGG